MKGAPARECAGPPGLRARPATAGGRRRTQPSSRNAAGLSALDSAPSAVALRFPTEPPWTPLPRGHCPQPWKLAVLLPSSRARQPELWGHEKKPINLPEVTVPGSAGSFSCSFPSPWWGDRGENGNQPSTPVSLVDSQGNGTTKPFSVLRLSELMMSSIYSPGGCHPGPPPLREAAPSTLKPE